MMLFAISLDKKAKNERVVNQLTNRLAKIFRFDKDIQISVRKYNKKNFHSCFSLPACFFVSLFLFCMKFCGF